MERATRSEVTGPKFTRFFTRCRGYIRGLCIGFAIFPNRCKMPAETRRGVSIFANTYHKSVTIATSIGGVRFKRLGRVAHG